jgi:hypothetical protein
MSMAHPPLYELQIGFRRAVLGGEVGDIAVVIASDGIDPAARLRIYRNHLLATLGAALRAVFPVVCRLIDERFFTYAVDEYLKEHPPRSRCLSEYGDDFPEFLAGFPPCKGLPYLADVARFEWALDTVSRAREATLLPPQALAAVPAERAGYVRFSLQPSVCYFTSPWPVDAIWHANQQREVPRVDLAIGETHLEIRGTGGGVVWRRLDPATFAFRLALASEAFAAAIAAATAQDPGFDPGAALQLVFAEGLAVDIGWLPDKS